MTDQDPTAEFLQNDPTRGERLEAPAPPPMQSPEPEPPAAAAPSIEDDFNRRVEAIRRRPGSSS